MKFTVERDVLADAVAWAARSLPVRPSVPVLAGVSATDWIVAAGGHLLHVGERVAPVDRDNRAVMPAATAK